MLYKFQTAFCLLLLSLVFINSQDKYIAVVDFQADTQTSSHSSTLEINTEAYIEAIVEASKSKKLIAIVFPEGTLDNAHKKAQLKALSTKITPRENPCFADSQHYPIFMQQLSCAAGEYKTAIIFNVIEAVSDEYYTSDVVLDENGDIVLSLPRENRIGANFLQRGPIPFVVPARSPFNLENNISFVVTSLVTGFSFSHEKVVDMENQRTYVACSNWVSQLPFLTSLQVHQMWAQAFNITLFFSGANNPDKAQGGTGIYHGGAILMHSIPNYGIKTYMYKFSDIATPGELTTSDEQSSDEASQAMDEVYFEVDPDLKEYKSKLLDPRRSEFEVQLCYDKVSANHFCCDFKLNMSYNDSVVSYYEQQYFYRLVAYRGVKTYYNIFNPGGVEICAIIACMDKEISSCGKRFDISSYVVWPLTFESIEIKAEFEAPEREKIYISTQFPNSLLTSMKPIDPNDTEWKEETIAEFNDYDYQEKIQRTFRLTKPYQKILTFGIFGRNFTVERPDESNDRIYFLWPWLIIVVFCVLLF